jgi:hypothetical protein
MGSGYKAFTAGAVLTASDVNNYLMEQGVMYFATTAARDAALSGSLEDGMVAYVGSNDANEGFYTYNGTSWRKGPGWNAPWGFIQYAERTTAISIKNGNIVTSNISVVNGRRYRIQGQIQSFQSTTAGDVCELSITVGGTIISGTRVTAQTVNFAGYGLHVVAYYTATATNASLACNLYNNAIVGAGTHQFSAAAATPTFIAVEDVGPSGAPV